jgi:hypothetical protein
MYSESGHKRVILKKTSPNDTIIFQNFIFVNEAYYAFISSHIMLDFKI